MSMLSRIRKNFFKIRIFLEIEFLNARILEMVQTTLHLNPRVIHLQQQPI